ncbi:gluconate 2-dehydrogenase subunit 3 family protein [Paraburkholderia edwinii]|uniref:Gluconate 2-dehydrogenase subunit 3 family protein n=1 Tax=Paraburkholderia edwinii TaxID=2861782 RepID=A0ABX8UIU5_9BURK|nr:gluconate 2-dehydrogenase subunit 3 family protein [Paraburkholderia edwinii]QYD67257.1 gluconate 2-dehydrogenase subunit 3 family protein [Paraburkholderia edwinii]
MGKHLHAHRPLPAYPDYDVLDKRDSPSWDDATRSVIDDRIDTRDEPAWCTPDEWRTLRALCSVIIPQPRHRPAVALAALVDRKIAANRTDGYRNASLPGLQQAWRIGLAALDDESHHRYRAAFADIDEHARIGLVQAMEHGTLTREAWRNMSAKLFFKQRVLHDLCTTYYAHPSSWSDIGFGGPANPRGYVRMTVNRRDPWEAVDSTGEQAAEERETRRAR